MQAIESGFDVDIGEEKLVTINQFRNIVSDCWEGKELLSEQIELFEELIKEKEWMIVFTDIFDEYRKNGIYSMNVEGYKTISSLIKIFLDQAAENKDIKSALKIMKLSQTYYVNNTLLDLSKEESKDGKLFLQTGIQYHSLWVNKEFWKTALEILTKDDSQNEDQDEPSPEEVKRIKNVIFRELRAAITNMISFGMKLDDIRTLVLNFAEKSELPDSFITTLEVLYINFRKS